MKRKFKEITINDSEGIEITTPEFKITIGHGIMIKNHTSSPIVVHSREESGYTTFEPNVGYSLIMPK